jgi:hypothetical protein
LAILLSANAPARAQLDFATQTDTRYPSVSSDEWVETGDTPVVTLSESLTSEQPSPATGQSVGIAASVAQHSAGSRGAQLFPALGQQQPHPAVVRIIAAEPGGASLGSGTLVDSNDDSGLIITNWHVVRDAPGCVIVLFPDGFQSMGHVLRMDSDWDLAAILIKKPQTAPVKVAREAPQLGERLTIAGYGSGKYRAANGACTQYLAPSTRHPFELVELAASARQGDSGGPIFNSRGELAGVLFGEGGGRTTGAYCGRVHNFLTLAVHQLHQAKNATLAANAPPAARPQRTDESALAGGSSSSGIERPNSGAVGSVALARDLVRAKPIAPAPSGEFAAERPLEYFDAFAPPQLISNSQRTPNDLVNPPPDARANQKSDERLTHATTAAPIAAIASGSGVVASDAPSIATTSSPTANAGSKATAELPGNGQSKPAEPSNVENATRDFDSCLDSIHQQVFAGDSLISQIKTVLAGIGLLACLFHGTRVLARTTTGGARSAGRKKSKYAS